MSERYGGKHVWISNAAFTRLTGIKKVCMDCGQPNDTAPKTCTGKRDRQKSVLREES